jgi:hypothetical protein
MKEMSKQIEKLRSIEEADESGGETKMIQNTERVIEEADEGATVAVIVT